MANKNLPRIAIMKGQSDDLYRVCIMPRGRCAEPGSEAAVEDRSGETADGCLRFPNLLSLMMPDGSREPVPIRHAEAIGGARSREGAPTLGDGWKLSGGNGRLDVRSEWRLAGAECGYVEVALELMSLSGAAATFGLRFECEVTGAGRPTWMIPGAFYRENRFEHNTRQYPRYAYEGGDPRKMVSDYWSFRADRAALPAVLAWNDELCGGLCVEEYSALGLNGLGFRGNRDGTRIWVDAPYREEPVVFAGEPVPEPADVQMYTLQPGERIQLQIKIYAAAPDLHAYNPFIREMYNRHRERHGLNPWVGLAKAAELTDTACSGGIIMTNITSCMRPQPSTAN